MPFCSEPTCEATDGPFYEQENAQLEKFAGRKLGTVGYRLLGNKQRLALYDFDEEQLRPYFPAERVVEGMFEISGGSMAREPRTGQTCRCGIRTCARRG